MNEPAGRIGRESVWLDNGTLMDDDVDNGLGTRPMWNRRSASKGWGVGGHGPAGGQAVGGAPPRRAGAGAELCGLSSAGCLSQTRNALTTRKGEPNRISQVLRLGGRFQFQPQNTYY